MEILGKCRPKENVLKEVYSIGFDSVELYLTKDRLDDVEDIIEVCEESEVSISSVHSPHINSETDAAKEYFRKADRVANTLNATYLLHSNPFSTFSLVDFYSPEDVNSTSFCYENHPDVSRYFLKENLLDQNVPIALDIAHLYIAEENYLNIFEEFLSTYTPEEIPVIHLADGTRQNDGLYFGEGSIDIEAVFNLVSDLYNGKVVLEIPVSNRTESLEYSKKFL